MKKIKKFTAMLFLSMLVTGAATEGVSKSQGHPGAKTRIGWLVSLT